MSANLSLILNLLLLAGIAVAITRLIRQHRSRPETPAVPKEPRLGNPEHLATDDIIAVRCIDPSTDSNPSSPHTPDSTPIAGAQASSSSSSQGRSRPASSPPPGDTPETLKNPIMLFIAARKNRQFAGYELLQAILSAGLRFGDGNLFHRHQGDNGQGILMCSLAAATESGQFNLQRMGAFTCRGLCLFMEASTNSNIDEERFSVMLEVARRLAEELDALILDERHKPFSEHSLHYYEQRLGCVLAMTADAD
ncbi:MAG: cell division protein ZipA C-terminal FtsZ-binding domain-containing protein [Legionellaceae bacterium]|nr:cell division protein ZipA C-terminal FtsZ-binding domain-containing protein [Legionellaceae bacterium]